MIMMSGLWNMYLEGWWWFFVVASQAVLKFICDYISGCGKSVETDRVSAEMEVEQNVVNEEGNIQMD